MKKLLALLLTFVMVFSFVPVTAFAAGNNGTITIQQPNEGTIYKVYKILDAQMSTNGSTSFSYRVADGWSGFFGTSTTKYFVIDANGFVTQRSTFTQDSQDVAEFAQLAFDYIKTHTILPYVTKTATTGDVVFNDLPLGYYLVDTSVGSLCALTLTQPTALVQLKNHVPTINKRVQEDSDANSGTAAYDYTNTADIGQKVKFDITIDAKKGAENYVVHDKMSSWLTLDSDSIVASHRVYESDPPTTLERNEDYVVKEGTEITDGCTFHIEFDNEFLATIAGEEKIYIQYDAILNSNAKAGEAAINEAELSFGETGANHRTKKFETKTFTYGFDIVKTDSSQTPIMLEGAEFELYTKHGEVYTKLNFVLVNEEMGIYRKATDDDVNTTSRIVVNKRDDGHAIARVYGLDTDMYYLKEIVPPVGYNAMVGYREVIINNANIDATFIDGENAGDPHVYNAPSGVQVINQKGVVLPSTGGTGTTMFIFLGTAAVIAAGVLLITKKRMSMFED